MADENSYVFKKEDVFKQAYLREKNIPDYGSFVRKTIEGIKDLSDEEKITFGILKDGKTDAEALWKYINNKIAEGIGKYNLGDATDIANKLQYDEVKSAVMQIKDQTLLFQQLAGSVENRGTQYARQQIVQAMSSLTTNDAKWVMRNLLKIAGSEDYLGGIVEESVLTPSDIGSAYSAVQGPFVQKVNTARQTANMADLENRIAAAAAPPEEHGGHSVAGAPAHPVVGESHGHDEHKAA